MSHKSLLAITLVLLVHTALAVEMDPFADPAHDPQNLFAKDPHTLNKFIAMHSAIVLSPCGFIATVYMLLGRLARHLHADDLLLLRPNIITKVYVTSDIRRSFFLNTSISLANILSQVTLLMQATGGGMGAANSQTTRDLGAKVFLAGFIAQCVSFVSYLVVFALFVHRMRSWRAPQYDSRPNGQFLHWTTLMWAIAICCAMITIRTAYRTVEAAQGLEGYLAIHEPYFYALDCIPLWTGIMAFVVVWPPKYLLFNHKPTGRVDSQLELRTPLYSRV
ncbi:hypothetical protein FRC12_010424 [Ceratobasidium sp. 428]|nr:hypothetical protein FRC12_010424 [Ceratobasidium sp. 428]